MLTKRIIPCLDVKDGRVVKGIRFLSLRDAGDPVEIARAYEKQKADELVFLDITASFEGRKTMLEVVRKVAANIFMPFTVGGGVRGIDDIRALLNAGADKVSINTTAVHDPELIRQASKRFGSQCIVVAIDAKKVTSHKSYPNGHRQVTSKIKRLEQDLLKKINQLNIGPMGLGGKTTAFGVSVLTYPTHIAGLPVCVNISCHALRSASKVL